MTHWLDCSARRGLFSDEAVVSVSGVDVFAGFEVIRLRRLRPAASARARGTYPKVANDPQYDYVAPAADELAKSLDALPARLRVVLVEKADNSATVLLPRPALDGRQTIEVPVSALAEMDDDTPAPAAWTAGTYDLTLDAMMRCHGLDQSKYHPSTHPLVNYTQPVRCDSQEGLLLHAGKTLLGRTRERLHIVNRVGHLELAGSVRQGLRVEVDRLTLTHFSGRLDVRISNTGGAPIRLHPGFVVGKLRVE